MSTSIKVNCRSLFCPPFVYNDFCLYLYISFIIIVYRVDKDLGKFICSFYSLLGPGFFLKKCLIFVTLGTVDVLDVNASVLCKAVCVSKFFFSFIQYQYWILGFAAGRGCSIFKAEGQYTDEMQMGELWSINTSLTPIKRKKTVWPRPVTTAFKTSQDWRKIMAKSSLKKSQL